MSETSALSRGLTALAREPLPRETAGQAWRTLYNVLGTAIGASLSDAVDAVLRNARAHGGKPTAPIPGRAERADPLSAALAIGLAAHYDGYDDVHPETAIHPGAATLGALLAVAEEQGARTASSRRCSPAEGMTALGRRAGSHATRSARWSSRCSRVAPPRCAPPRCAARRRGWPTLRIWMRSSAPARQRSPTDDGHRHHGPRHLDAARRLRR